MNTYTPRIEVLKKQVGIVKNETFSRVLSGTRSVVFSSDNYVIRFRDDHPELLQREADFLKQLDHPLIPKVVWVGTIDAFPVMIENRLLGNTLDTEWKSLSETSKTMIVQNIVEFISDLRHKHMDHVYSVNTGKMYQRFLDFLLDGTEQKLNAVKKFSKTNNIVESIQTILKDIKFHSLFQQEKDSVLVHGDLIIHNLLTDGKNLTGILDWEFAVWGDPDYDLFRLWYYHECAKAYYNQDIDETFEYDFMDKLISAIKNSGLIQDYLLFQKKYQFVRAIYRLNALYWVAASPEPEKNIEEFLQQWNEKGVKRKEKQSA